MGEVNPQVSFSFFCLLLGWFSLVVFVQFLFDSVRLDLARSFCFWFLCGVGVRQQSSVRCPRALGGFPAPAREGEKRLDAGCREGGSPQRAPRGAGALPASLRFCPASWLAADRPGARPSGGDLTGVSAGLPHSVRACVCVCNYYLWYSTWLHVKAVYINGVYVVYICVHSRAYTCVHTYVCVCA